MELAFTGAFAWAAWQVVGKLQRHAAKVEKHIDDIVLFGQFDEACRAKAERKERSSAAMGTGAAASGHDHIFEEWRASKLRPAQKSQLALDIADLAQWAGLGSWVPELRVDGPLKPWDEYGTAGKVHLLQAADHLQFNFADVVKQQAETLAGNWLWQVTEALPALSAEPVRSAEPVANLADLKTRLTEAEAAVRAAFDAERRSQAAALKGLVEPLAVAACMRKIQVLKVILEEVGLTPTNANAALGRIRAALKAPITLTPADGSVAQQKAAAAAAVAAEADAAVAAERTARMEEIEAAATRVYRRALTLQASSPSHWHSSSDTPALHRLGLLAALLAELSACDAAGSADGTAAAAELADSVRKLTPQMRIKLSEDQAARQAELLEALTPAPPAPPPAEAPADKAEPAQAAPAAEPSDAEPAAAEAEKPKEAEEGTKEEEEGAKAEEESEEGAVKAPAEGEEAEVEPKAEEPEAAEAKAAPRPAPGVAAAELRSLLEAAIRGQLAEAAASRKASRVAAKEAAAKEAEAARDAATAAAKEAAEAAAAATAAAEAAAAAKAKLGAPKAAAAAEPSAAAEAEAAAADAEAEAKASEEPEAAEAQPEAAASVEKGEAAEEKAAEGEAPAAEPVAEESAAEKKDEGEQPATAEEKEAEAKPAPDAEAEAVPAAEVQADAAEDTAEAAAEAEAKAAEAEAAAKAAAEAEGRAAEAEGKAKEAEAKAAEAAAAAEADEPPSPEEAVDVEAVRKGVEEEARARAEAEKEAAVLKLQDALEALRIRVSAKALEALVAKATAAAVPASDSGSADAAESAADADAATTQLDAGARLLALESHLRGTDAANDIALPGAVADAAAKLTAADRAVLDAASAAALARLEAAADRVRLTADVLKMDMGPGCCDTLRRAAAWLAEEEKRVAAAAERAAAKATRAAAKAKAAEAAKEAAEAAAPAEAEAEEQKSPEEGEEAAAAAAAEGSAEDGSADKEEKEESAQEVSEEVTEEVTEDIVAHETEEEEAEGDDEEEEDEVGPVDLSRMAEGRQLVAELLLEGLVLLELPPPSNRKLQVLRESVDALNPVDGDGAVQHRVIITLKEVVGQLGPIGGSVDARVSQVAEESERERLLQVRSAALAIFTALAAFLRLETEAWEAAKSDLEQTKKAVFGLKVERRAESLAAGIEASGGVAERCASLASAVLGLRSAAAASSVAEAKAALQAAAEQAETLSASLSDYISYVRLREHALGNPVTAKAEAEDDFELALPSLDDMRSHHSDGAVWLDLAGMGLPPAPAADGEEEGGEEDAAEVAAHDEALAALQERLDGWHVSGLRLLARGQAALVTLGGASVDGGELRLTADIGLPSAKSLLQLGAEKIARLQVLAAESVSGPNSGVANPTHWYLLVAPSAVEPLQSCLRDNNYFGLQPGQIHVFANDVRPPLLNENFQVVLDSTGTHIARSQPGTGDVFLALRRTGALSHMRRVGVRCVQVDSVEDNVMGRPLDPAFLGACFATNIDCAAKVAVPGVQTDGPSALPELYSRYLELLGASSHLLPGLADAVPALGSYYFSLDFIRRVDRLLREQPLALYRLAPAEKVPTRGSAAGAAAAAKAAAAAGGAAAASSAAGGSPGYRLERRLSDFASPAICQLLEGVHVAMAAVDTGAEFAPVWGVSPFYRTASPKAAVDALLLQHTRWVEESGGAVAEEDDVVEVSPLVSYAGEGLGPLVEGKTFDEAYVHELQGFAAESLNTGSNLGLWVLPSVVLYGGVAAAKLLGKASGK